MTTPEPQPLFPPSLISQTITSTLPAPYKIRPLERNDYEKGFLDCLRVLTDVGDVSQERFTERYDWMTEQAKGGYYFLVIEDVSDGEGKIVGTGALILERKFIHNLGIIGHIEEIAIRQEHQGKKLGIAMIKALDSVAVNVGCYKTILNCGERNEGFYIKCGYRKAALEMVHYYEEEKSAYERG